MIIPAVLIKNHVKEEISPNPRFESPNSICTESSIEKTATTKNVFIVPLISCLRFLRFTIGSLILIRSDRNKFNFAKRKKGKSVNSR
tara:strand:- start:7888 stop:8148 length:261 start_codon:yes stop_codon:yes gene_type:complete